MNLENLIGTAIVHLLSRPENLEGLFTSLNGIGCHTALDACQDILDAADHGKISIPAARKAINVILDDLEARHISQDSASDLRQLETRLKRLYTN